VVCSSVSNMLRSGHDSTRAAAFTFILRVELFPAQMWWCNAPTLRSLKVRGQDSTRAADLTTSPIFCGFSSIAEPAPLRVPKVVVSIC